MKANKLVGLVLVIVGFLFLGLQILNQMNIVLFGFWDFWPLYTIALGLVFEMLYFSSKYSPGFLVPGGIVTSIGVIHLFEVITNWHFAGYTWPLYILAIVIGFFQYYIFTKQKWSLILATIIFIVFLFNSFIVVSLLVSGTIDFSVIFSILTILIGSLLLLTSKFKY